MKSTNVLTKRQRIAMLAKQMPHLSFTSLNQHIDEEWMVEAYKQLKKKCSPGVSGETVSDYGENLYNNISTLIDRAKSGFYVAPPVRRVYIPKDDKGIEKRKIGIPETEDKLLQRAVVMLLEPIYEQEFLNCSYGFRPEKSAHQALDSIWKNLMGTKGGWVIDLDIRKFFDTLDHAELRKLLKQRVCDGVIMRLIGKWLNAGVMDKGNISYPDQGSPQGGVVSPMLSNIYLHYVLDKWFIEEIKPRLKGKAELVRFADDAVLLFKCKEDALRVFEVLPKRFMKYGLTIHPEKSQMIEFLAPNGGKRSNSFDFLGFTHFWSRSRKGNWIVKRKTAKDRLRRTIKKFSKWCRSNRHMKIVEQYKKLSQKLNGHYNYFGITGNSKCLGQIFYRVRQIWRYWLNKRRRENEMPWDRFLNLEKHLKLPLPRAKHSVCIANL
ncbi:MAG: group II intron reverse transcriptase/maturase [candidate division Zixibacteria bacterium]|nr:group II intron reverse transcriptase/maturase [candidate division Zixibacteria bacterium]